MAFGISTSCLYPQETEKSLIQLADLGVKTCEVFLNSPSETTLDFAKILKGISEEHGIKIVSVHPFSSFAETYMLFSEYQRRFDDMLDFYKRNFEVTAAVGAKISVIHGSLLPAKISENEYFERFMKLVNAGKAFGITVAQENVNRHFSENPDFLKRMKTALGEDFKLVFDVKQAVRAGYSPIEFADTFKDDIIHIHLSDHNAEHDCMPPALGNFNFKELFSVMDSVNYAGDYIIELYRAGFGDISDLKKALNYLENL